MKEKNNIVIYQLEDGKTKIDVKLEDETVWLSQQQMADLYDTTKQNISLHIKNIFDEEELIENSTVKEFLTVRKVERKVKYYNLDMIISLGYRIKSKVATNFRRWATERLKEYNFKVYAVDLWSDPVDNEKFFKEMGLTSKEIIPIKADATKLDFPKEFFDAVVSTDSYNYFGRDEEYLDKLLLPYVKNGGYIYITVPGMKKDCHNNLPSELLLSWTKEQLDYLHDTEYWYKIISKSKNSEIISIHEMEGNEELWLDWINCDNEYAKNDRLSIEAGACKYLNFIAIILKKK